MREFIRLQLKLKWGINRNNDKASAIMTAVASLFAVAVVLALVFALSGVLIGSIYVSVKRLAVMYLTLVAGGLTVYATGSWLTKLYRPGDLNIMARFPISPFKMYVSYLVLGYIELLVYSAALVVPIMFVLGAAAHAFSTIYVLGAFVGAFLMPVVPFALSILIAIPVTFVAAALEKHGIVRLVLFVLLLAGCFALYNYVLTALAKFFIHRNWEEGTLDIWKKLLASLDCGYNPVYYLTNVMFIETFRDFGIGLAVIAGGGAALVAAGAALARLFYGRVRRNALDSGFGGSERRSRLDGYGSARSILRYTFGEIVRTKTYSYFYLGVAISTPVMVFFCSRLVHIVGEADIGSGINFGAAMLVVAAFMAMICSFTGTILSVEGKNFYITKLVPVSYRKQLLVKAVINVAVAFVAIAISMIVMGVLEFVTAAETAVLVASSAVFATGLVFNGINLNLANPNLKPKANGEAEEINVTYMLIIGIVIAAGLGAAAIILPRLEGVDGKMLAYIVCAGAAVVYAAVNFIVFWFTANKKYRGIEV